MYDIPGYKLLSTIQVTATNVLYRAVRQGEEHSLILKTPNSAHPGPLDRERYRREHSILQRLREVPGVSHVQGHEVAQGRPLLLLEDVKGQTLSELIEGPLELPRFLNLAIALAAAVSAVHNRGVIHKDIKSSNILLGPGEEPWLIDFGISTLQRLEHVDAAHPAQVDGTLAYMSPEQTGRMNRPVDYRTDLYSLGVVFYELLTGRRPFQGRDALEWFHAHMAQAPRPPHEANPSVPRVLSAIVLKLLAKVAEERYQGAEGLKVDLERCRERLRQGGALEFPLGERDVPARFQPVQRLFGRDQEVARLLAGIERVASGGKPELLLVSGYSGIGKSSVVQAFHGALRQRRCLFLSGKFDQFGHDVPYATMAQALRGLVQHLLALSEEELAAWRQRMCEAWQNHGQIILDLVPSLELIVGRQPPVPELSAGDAQRRFHFVLQGFLGVFASREQPLVLFLDDLQWIDPASVNLLQYLVTSPSSPSLMLIGAYRDNELSAVHPLKQMLERLRGLGVVPEDISLAPLSLEQILELLAHTLPGTDAERLSPLALLAREKTGGNPFFLNRLLLTLYHDGLLTRGGTGHWNWDEEGIRARGYSDNVVDFLVGQLRQLPAAPQHLLRLAACVGNEFPLHMLILLADTPAAEVEQGLEPALQEGLLERSGPERYRFLHDRIQQSAHALLQEAERKATHLRAGRLLRASMSPAELKERIFDVVNQLNAGAELMEDPRERHELARLNAEAGWRAKAAAAHRAASTYLAMAFSLIPGDPWKEDHELAFKLSLERARSELMTANAPEALRMASELHGKVLTAPQRAALHRFQAELYTATGNPTAAVNCLLEGLRHFGIHISLETSAEAVQAAHEEVRALLGERPIESLIHLPRMEDPDKSAAMDLLMALQPASFFIGTHLFAFEVCLMVALTLRYGHAVSSLQGYSSYGMLLGNMFKRYDEGDRFGHLVQRLLEEGELAAPRGTVTMQLMLITYWSRPLTHSLELAQEALKHSAATGSYQIACYSSNYVVTNRLSLGHDLIELNQEAEEQLGFVRRVGFRDVVDIIRPVQRFVQQMRGLTPSFQSLDGDDFNERQFEAALTPNRMSTMRCWYWILKLRSRFMCDAIGEAREAAAQARALLWASLGHIQCMDYHVYSALALAAEMTQAPELRRQEDLEALQQHHRQLVEWAEACPENFRTVERMVAAELSRLAGRMEDALEAYEDAVQWARKGGFIQYVALAHELAARFWQERRKETLALAHAREARDAYRQWGAEGKARQLEGRWPRLAVAPGGMSGTTHDTGPGPFDALTVVKAQQAISSEIVLEKLVVRLMRVALENAGAQRGALLLPRGDKLFIVACLEAAQAEPPAWQEMALEESDAVPRSVILYAHRTGQSVTLDDARNAPQFREDPYLSSRQVKSVLCLPAVGQGRWQGVLYLENNLATGAFTAERLQVLQLLTTQAAISLENAQLYDTLEQKVELRTRELQEKNEALAKALRELKETQDRMLMQSRLAALGSLTAGIAHELRNPLNFVNNFTRLSESLAEQVHQELDQLSGSPPPGTLERLREATGDIQANLARVTEHGARASRIISSMLEHARSGPGTRVETDLNALVQETTHMAWHGIRSRQPTLDATLRLELEDSLGKVVVAREEVGRVLLNLLDNAFGATLARKRAQKAGAYQPEIVVKSRSLGDQVEVRVRDNGTGIPQAIHQRVFDPFFTTKPPGEGTGLGLSLSREIVEQGNGGTLRFETQVDVFTEFIITLPRRTG